MTDEVWPALPLEEWKDTYATVHRWSQVVGKISLALTPLINHWWNVTFFVTARGLTTRPMPYQGRAFTMEFDFVDHQLVVASTDGATILMPLTPRSVAEFYRELMRQLRDIGIDVKIWPVPVEMPDPVPFEQDVEHRSYDPEYANRFWRILVQADRVLTKFRTQFIGKCSPVHFFWGGFDMAVTRFSGRRAPPRHDTILPQVMQESYSHEVISHGFWPGGGPMATAAFYAYAAPEPAGLKTAAIEPAEAYYHQELSLFILPYDAVRTASSPETTLLRFLQSTYERAADLAAWNRAELERS